MDFAEIIYRYAFLHVCLFWGVISLTLLIAILVAFRWRREGRSFAMMTLVWVLINAIIGYWLWWHIHVPTEAYLPHTFAHTLYWMRVNVFLDFGYGIVGICLLHRSRRIFRHKYMIAAFGKAVLLQSVCLLLIDAVFWGRLYFLFQVYTGVH